MRKKPVEREKKKKKKTKSIEREKETTMAEETKENEEKVKLFVGQVPKHMTETQLLALFQEFSIVDEVNIIKDKITRASRGFFFI